MSTAKPQSRRRFLIKSAGVAAAASLSTPIVAAASEHTHTSTASIHSEGQQAMNTLITEDGTQIYYKAWGTGQPVVFSHGWPLSG